MEDHVKKVTPPRITVQKRKPIDMSQAKGQSSPSTTMVVVSSLVIILAGIGTGYLVAGSTGVKPTKDATSDETVMNETGEAVPKVAGLENVKGVDDATGKLLEGGIDGEGSHHLERPGGISQNVYLVSSTVDLDKYIGKEVKVWGQTNDTQKAGWFMDVVKLEVVE